MRPFLVAVITPFHSEPMAYLDCARKSVQRQTWPHVLHLLVGDQSELHPEEDARTVTVFLPRGCRDYGDTPRALGALYAAGLGADAVAFLDADNWYQPQHLESLVRLHLETGAHVVTSRRAFHRMDGSYMAECTASDGVKFADTNCLFIARPAFGLLSRWVLMDRLWHGIDDRVFWDHVKQTGTPTSHTGRATAAYRGQFEGLYVDLKEQVPPGSRKPHNVRLALESWNQATGRPLNVDWGYCRHLPPSKVLDVYALTIREQGAVSLTRVHRPLESLAQSGAVRVQIGTQLTLPQQGNPGILVLHRHFLANPEMLEHINRLAARGWVLVSDIDDDPHHWPGYVDSRMIAFKGVHAVTVSTPFLARLVRQWNPHVQVFQNMVDDLPPVLGEKRARTIAQADRPEESRPAGPLRMFFGAFNRRSDAQVLLEGVNMLPEELQSRLHAVVLHDQGVFNALPPGITREFHPTCRWAQYMELLAGCDVALLPLADTTFNHFKSDLKLIEALAAGAVPICSPVVYGEVHARSAPYVRWAESPEEWARQLSDALSNPAEWAEARALGYAYVHANRMQWQQDLQRLKVYRQLMAEQPRLEAERQERLSVWKAEAA